MSLENSIKVFWWILYELIASKVPVHLRSMRWFTAYCAARYCDNVSATAHINPNARLSRQCTIGANAGIGEGSILSGEVHIGSGVVMGPYCYFVTGDHPVPDDYGRFRDLEPTHSPIYVEEDVLLGGRVIVLPGVRIGKGAAVGAGSVVTKDVAAGATVAGNPAREIRRRLV